MLRPYPKIRHTLLAEAATNYSKGHYLTWLASLTPEQVHSLNLEFDDFHKQIKTIRKLIALKSWKSAGEKFESLFEDFGIGFSALGLITAIDRTNEMTP